MAALTVKHLLDAGTVPASQNTTASDTADYGDGHNAFLVYSNTSGGTVTVTITPTLVLSNGTLYPAKTWSIATGTSVWIPLRREYDDGTGANTATVTTASPGATLQVTLVHVDY